MQSVSREVCFPGVELVALAGSYDVSGLGDCGGPVKALLKCIAHEGPWGSVMAADAGVNVSDQFLALGDGDAAL